MTDNELDVLLKNKINEVNVDVDLNINDIVYNVDRNKKKERVQLSVLVACIIVALVVIIDIIPMNINENELSITSQKLELSTEPDENYGIIEIENEEKISDLYDGTAARVFITRSSYLDSALTIETEKEEELVLAKVEDLYYTNWDKDNKEEYNYVPLRTVASIKIKKNITGKLDLNELKEVRAIGGIIEYEQYMKFLENTDTVFNDEILKEEYNKLIEEGKEKVYVSSFGKNDTRLEKGKNYLMWIHKKAWGDYWVDNIREYDEETDSVLNYETGKYEKLEDIVN